MFFAEIDGVRSPATPGRRAICPICHNEVISKCGDIVSWHWSHVASEDCDSWSEGETKWHLEWKRIAEEILKGSTEVTIKRDGQHHRADIQASSRAVIELQHSAIATSEIEKRENFYGEMWWLFDVTDAYFHGRIILRDKSTRFWWKHGKKSLRAVSQKLFLDFGEEVFEVTKFQRRCSGLGKLLSKADFIRLMEAKILGLPAPVVQGVQKDTLFDPRHPWYVQEETQKQKQQEELLRKQERKTSPSTTGKSLLELLNRAAEDPTTLAATGEPCSCGSPFAWRTVYGEFRCWHCQPPPSQSFVESRYTLNGGEWELHPSDRWEPRRGDERAPEDDEAGQLEYAPGTLAPWLPFPERQSDGHAPVRKGKKPRNLCFPFPGN
jgi:competence protein CoiA